MYKFYCIGCQEELKAVVVSLDFSSSDHYCNNSACPRYGLSTVLMKEEEQKDEIFKRS